MTLKPTSNACVALMRDQGVAGIFPPPQTTQGAEANSGVHGGVPNRDEWTRFRSMLDHATVFGGRQESSGNSRHKCLVLYKCRTRVKITPINNAELTENRR